VIVLDVSTGQIKRTFDYPESVRNPAFSSDGTILAINCWDRDRSENHVEVLDLGTGKTKEFPKTEGISFTNLLPDGKRFATWDEDHVRFFEVNSGEQFAATDLSPAMFGPASWGLNDPVPIPGTHLLAVPSANDWKPSLFLQWYGRLFGAKDYGKPRFPWGLAFLDTRTGNKIAQIEVPSVGGAISPDGQTLALPIKDYEEGSTIELWDIPPCKPLGWVLGLLAIPSVVTLITLMKIRRRFFRNRDRQGAWAKPLPNGCGSDSARASHLD
jgi:WD40 repeat protein